jgi:hypothetical protein
MRTRKKLSSCLPRQTEEGLPLRFKNDDCPRRFVLAASRRALARMQTSGLGARQVVKFLFGETTGESPEQNAFCRSRLARWAFQQNADETRRRTLLTRPTGRCRWDSESLLPEVCIDYAGDAPTNRSLMAKISDNVKGSGCWAQLTGQFAVEEMISITRASRFTGGGRGMAFPPFIANLLKTYKSRPAARIRFAIDEQEGVARRTQGSTE